MRLLQVKLLFLFVISFFASNGSSAQNLAADTTASPAVKNALALYNAAFHEQLNLYNGREYKDYLHPFDQGQPYFLTNQWSKGTIDFDGNAYENVSILYDLIADEVIILGNNNVSKINLFKDKLRAFSVSGHYFINLSKDSIEGTGLSAGFYDVLCNGKVLLLARRTKNIQTYIVQTIERKIFDKNRFYLKKNGVYVSVDNKKSLLKQLDDKRKQLQQYAKQNKLKFGKSAENSLTKMVQYYNQITQ